MTTRRQHAHDSIRPSQLTAALGIKCTSGFQVRVCVRKGGGGGVGTCTLGAIFGNMLLGMAHK